MARKASGGDGVHHERQQWNADNGESTTERALHEADQEYAGKGDEDCGSRQLQVSASEEIPKSRVSTLTGPPAAGRPAGSGHAMTGDHAQHEIQDLKKVSRSALIASAFVVGMPCGKPL